MKQILLSLLTAFMLCSASLKTTDLRIRGFGDIDVPVELYPTIDWLVEEYNTYNYVRLRHLADSLLNGVVDTSLSTDSMINLFLSTSKIGSDVKLSADSRNIQSAMGVYFGTDSTVYIDMSIQNKELVMYILIHELTHSIQHNYGYFSYGREDLIIEELFADYIAARFTGHREFSQTNRILVRYTDYYYEPYLLQVVIIGLFFEQITELLTEGD